MGRTGAIVKKTTRVRRLGLALTMVVVALMFAGSGDATADAANTPVHFSGVLRDADGGGLGGQWLSLSGEGTFETAVTAADGSFALAVSPGRYSVVANFRGSWSIDSWTMVTHEFDLVSDRTVELRLPPRSSVTVHVRGEHGEPLVGARVDLVRFQLWDVDLGDLTAGWLETARLAGETDANGDFATRVFSGGRAIAPGIVYAHPGYAAREFSLPVATSDISLTVEPRPLRRLSGVLRDSAGQPIADSPISFISDERYVNVQTAQDGSFAVNAPQDQYRMAGQVPGSWLNTRQFFDADFFDLNRDRSFDFQMPPTVPLTVVVERSDGGRLLDAQVAVPDMRAEGTFGGLPARFIARPPVRSTGADGAVTVQVFDGGQAEVTGLVTPPASSPYEPREFTPPTIAGATTMVVRYPPPDGVAPLIECDPLPVGWVAEGGGVACTATDQDGSGLANPDDAGFTLLAQVGPNEERPYGMTATRVVCDRAGNCATAGPFAPIAVDSWAPRISFSQNADGGGGWWVGARASAKVTTEDVNLGTIACSVDGVARTLSSPSRTPTTLTGSLAASAEGRHVVGCTATDTLGHIRSASEQVLIDRHAPFTPAVTFGREPEYPGGGWFRDAVTVTFEPVGDRDLTDGSPGSGADPASVTDQVTIDSEGITRVSGSIADVAGNVSAARTATVKVDTSDPTTTLTCPAQVNLSARATARWADADTGAGVAARAGTIPLDTSALGWQTAQRVASDRVGHTAEAACAYQVVYPLQFVGGLLLPPQLNPIAPGVAATVIRFTLGGDRGLDVLAGAPRVQPITCIGGMALSEPRDASPSAPLRFGSGRYSYSWQVETDVPAGSCAALTFDLADGTAHELRFAR